MNDWLFIIGGLIAGAAGGRTLARWLWRRLNRIENRLDRLELNLQFLFEETVLFKDGRR